MRRFPDFRRRTFLHLVAVAAGLLAACSDASIPAAPLLRDGAIGDAKAPTGLSVTSTDPADSRRGVTIDVKINGSGFSAGAVATFRLSGVDDPKVRTNSTTYVSSTQLVANITIDPDATPDFRDVMVTSSGKQGIGSELFTVLDVGVMDVAGFAEAQGASVNSSGVAVGNGVSNACVQRAFTWTQAGGSVMLPLAAGYCGNMAAHIRDDGAIAGIAMTTAIVNSPGTQIAIYTPDGAGGWTIDVLPKPRADATWLSTASFTKTGALVSLWRYPDMTVDAWYWSTGTGWISLARTAGATTCYPHGMNERGEVVGHCGGAPLYWASPTSAPVQIPATGGTANSASDINDAGVIAGAYDLRRTTRAARWTPNGTGGWAMQDLGMVGTARTINDDGAITISNAGSWWYMAPDGTVTQLDPLSHYGGATIALARPGNRGTDGVTWIVGYGSENTNTGYRALWWRR